jgi:hypothetical protein
VAFSPKRAIPDADYLLQRAVTEADWARQAQSKTCAEIHHQLASCYLDRAFGEHCDVAPGKKTVPSSDAGSFLLSRMRGPDGGPKLEPIPDEFAELLARLDD